MTMQLEYDFQRNYTETFTRTVGATTSTTARGTLPQPAPDNTNSVWVAPNGSDANPGTQASPKATLFGAWAILTGTKNNIQIFRNSYVGDLIITETSSIAAAPPSNISVQCELGEIATIVSGSSLNMRVSTYSLTMNGLRFEVDSYRVVCNNGCTIENCTFENPQSNLSFSGITSEVTAVTNSTLTIKYCNFFNTWIGFHYFVNLVFENNIHLHIVSTEGTGEAFSSGTGVRIQYTASSPVAISRNYTLKRNIFAGFAPASVVDSISDNRNIYGVPIMYVDVTNNSANSSTSNMTLESNLFFNNLVSLIYYGFQSSLSARDPKLNIVTTNNQFSGLNIFAWQNDDIPGGATTSVTDTGQLNEDLPNMLLDVVLALTGDVNSFRLQRVGLTTPDGTGKYFINSPLIDAGVSSVDISPFDESVSLSTEGYNKLIGIDWPPVSMTIETQHSNPSNLVDVNGNLHRDYDKERRRFVFVFGDNIALSNLQMKQLRDLLSDRGSKRFYPLGLGGNMFTENTVSAGVFSDVDNSIAPTEAISTAMVAGHWRGFWAVIGSDAFYITDNDATKLYLVDKLGNGWPSNGAIGFLVEHILINIEANAYIFKQTNFTQFTKGGFLRENTENTQPYDYTIEGVTFDEIEDNEENI
jgi:hypothetical protein